MSLAELKIISKIEEVEKIDETTRFCYIESFHPAVLKLLAADRLIGQNDSEKAYTAQSKVNFNSKVRHKPNLLLDKKVS